MMSTPTPTLVVYVPGQKPLTIASFEVPRKEFGLDGFAQIRGSFIFFGTDLRDVLGEHVEVEYDSPPLSLRFSARVMSGVHVGKSSQHQYLAEYQSLGPPHLVVGDWEDDADAPTVVVQV